MAEPYLILLTVFAGLFALAFVAIAIVVLSVGRRILALLSIAQTETWQGKKWAWLPIVAAVIIELMRRRKIV